MRVSQLSPPVLRSHEQLDVYATHSKYIVSPIVLVKSLDGKSRWGILNVLVLTTSST